jgi:hypothetical protein
MLKLILAHLLGNAVLLGLGYYWLGVGEANWVSLTWSALLVVLFVAGAVWLHGAALAYFRHDQQALAAIPRNPARRWLPLVLFGAVVLGVFLALEIWNPVSTERINATASWLTLTFQTPVRPDRVQRVLGMLWWLVEWLVAPLALLPVASGVALRGWTGFAEFALPKWSRLLGRR